VTEEVLAQIAAAEDALRDLGFRQVRVRHHGDVARIEVDADEIARLAELRELVVRGVRSAGYTFVAADLDGYATGRLSRGSVGKTQSRP
jgi:uncharacterized protein